MKTKRLAELEAEHSKLCDEVRNLETELNYYHPPGRFDHVQNEVKQLQNTTKLLHQMIEDLKNEFRSVVEYLGLEIEEYPADRKKVKMSAEEL